MQEEQIIAISKPAQQEPLKRQVSKEELAQLLTAIQFSINPIHNFEMDRIRASVDVDNNTIEAKLSLKLQTVALWPAGEFLKQTLEELDVFEAAILSKWADELLLVSDTQMPDLSISFDFSDNVREITVNKTTRSSKRKPALKKIGKKFGINKNK